MLRYAPGSPRAEPVPLEEIQARFREGDAALEASRQAKLRELESELRSPEFAARGSAASVLSPGGSRQ